MAAGEMLGPGLGPVPGGELGDADGDGDALGGGVARSARNWAAQAGSALTATPLCRAVALSFP